MLASDAGRHRSLLRVTFPTRYLQEPGFVGWGLEEKRIPSSRPWEIIKASQGLAFHSTWQFTLALKRHFRVSDLCHGVGWGEVPPGTAPVPGWQSPE